MTGPEVQSEPTIHIRVSHPEVALCSPAFSVRIPNQERALASTVAILMVINVPNRHDRMATDEVLARLGVLELTSRAAVFGEILRDRETEDHRIAEGQACLDPIDIG